MNMGPERLGWLAWGPPAIMGGVVFMMLGPWFGAPNAGLVEIWDLAHVPAGAILGLCLRVWWREVPRMALGVAVVLALGVVELSQGMLGRFPSWGDWLAGSFGALAALVWTVPKARLRAAGLLVAGVVVAVPLWVIGGGQQVGLRLAGSVPAGWWSGVPQEANVAGGQQMRPWRVDLDLHGGQYGGVAWPVRAGVAAAAQRLQVQVAGDSQKVPEVVVRLEAPGAVRWYHGQGRDAVQTVFEWDLESLEPAQRRAIRRLTVFFPGGEGRVSVCATWERQATGP